MELESCNDESIRHRFLGSQCSDLVMQIGQLHSVLEHSANGLVLGNSLFTIPYLITRILAMFKIFISLDRTMSVYFKAWNIIHFRSKQAIQLSIITIMFFALININILTEFGFETVENETTLMFCYKVEGYPKTYWMETYGQISLVVASLLPSIILIVSNIALVVRVRRRSRLTEPSTSQSIKRCSRLNNLVVVLTVVFMISTLPVSCAGFFFTQLFSTDWGIFLIAVLDCLSFTYSAFNFVITYMTNRRFKRQVKILFKLVVRRS